MATKKVLFTYRFDNGDMTKHTAPNTRLVKTGRVVQLDNDNNVQTHQRFDALCG